MSSWIKAAVLLAGLVSFPGAVAADPANPFAGRDSELGRIATSAEIRAWDIDVRPDFSGLPEGAGTALEGEEIWLEQCAACHGDFGDANNFFSPLVLGNVTDEDIETGTVAALTDPTRVRTTLMKASTVSTLWDYIYRAMPWNNPKSLSPDDVYAVLAYLLNLAYVIDEEFVLNRDSMVEVQARMPNRNGMTTDHGLWKVSGEPDVTNTRCMKDCQSRPEITSFIPEFAMNAHGNLALQNRPYGPYRGLDTSDDADSDQAAAVKAQPSHDGKRLVADKGCTACHQQGKDLIGPAFKAVADKYGSDPDARGYLATKIRAGGSGVWNGVMPPQSQVSENEAGVIADWLLSLNQGTD